MTDESQKYKSPGLVGWCRHHHVNIRGLVFRKMTEEIWKDVPGYEGEYLVSNYARFLRVHDGKMLHPSKNHANYDVISFRRKQFRVARIVCTAFNSNPENLPFVDHIDTDRSNNCAWNLRWCTAKGNAQNPISRIHWRESKLGEKNPNYGKKYTEEEKKRLSKILSGRKLTKIHKQRISQAEKGRVFSKETRIRMSASAKKKQVNQYSRQGAFLNTWRSMCDVEKATGIFATHISACCSRKAKTAGGFLWCYADDTVRIKQIESLKQKNIVK